MRQKDGCSSPPKIMPFQFNPIKVQEGEKALASCYASSGNRPFRVRWLRNGEPLHKQTGLIEITNLDTISILEFSSARVQDQANYTCELTNDQGKDVYTTELFVTAPPKWISFSNDEIVAIGQQSKLKCFAEGSPKPTIAWLFSKNQQEDHTFQRLYQQDNISFENDSSVLVIQGSSKNNEGVYRCEASNQLGSSITREIRLKVEVPPKFIYAQGNLTIGLGATTELRCESDDQPKPQITWHKIWPNKNSRTVFSSSQIYPDGSQKSTITKQYIGSGTRFTLTNVKADDGGLYECMAENIKTSLSTSQLFRVDIKLPAKIVKKDTTVTVKRDENAKLSCVVEGTGPIQVVWSKQERNGLFVPIFDPDSKHHSDQSNQDRVAALSRDYENNTIFELHINLVRQKDQASYLCKATNEFGEDSSKIQLTVQDVPEPPERLEIDHVWSRSASLRWTPVVNLPNSPPIKNYLLQYWRDVPNNQQTTSNNHSDSNGDAQSNHDLSYGSVYRLFEIEIPANQNQYMIKTNLLPGNNYRLRLYSINEFGKSHFSANQRLTTEQEEPSLPPSDIRVHSKSTSTIKLSWRAPLKNSWNGPLTSYVVAFKMLKEDEVNNLQSLSSAEQTFAFNTVKFLGQPADDYYQEYTLSNLQKETLYCIMIRSVNKVGHGPYSQPIVTSTANNDPPHAPSPWIDTVQKNSMVVKWTQSGNKDELTHYILYYKDDKDYKIWLETTFSAKDKNSYTLTGLNENTIYEIYMRANSHHGLSEPSKVIRQMTQSNKETGGSLISLQDRASRMFGTYGNIPPYLRAHVIIPVSIALVLIVIICAVAVGYIKYEEKKTAIIRANLSMMASSPSKQFQYINSSVSSPTAPNITTNQLFNLTNQQSLNNSSVSEEGYHSLKFSDYDKTNRPLLSGRPSGSSIASTMQQSANSSNLWIKRQSPIMEESESCSLVDDSFSNPYATLPFEKNDNTFSTPIKAAPNQLPPPVPSTGRPASINLLTSAINLGKQFEHSNLFDLNNTTANASTISNSSFHPKLNSTVTSGTYSQELSLNDRKNYSSTIADVHNNRDCRDSDNYDFFS